MKRKLFDEGLLRSELASAVVRNDVVAQVKLENRLVLNSGLGCSNLSVKTLKSVLKNLEAFNKDRRSYGINTGVEICIDIVKEMLLEVEDD